MHVSYHSFAFNLYVVIEVRSEGGSECRVIAEAKAAEAISTGTGPSTKKRKTGGNEEESWDGSANEQGASSQT